MKRNSAEEASSSSTNFAEGLHFEFDFPVYGSKYIPGNSNHSFVGSIPSTINSDSFTFQSKPILNWPSFQKVSIFSLVALFFALCLFSVVHLFEVDTNSIGSRLHAKKEAVTLTEHPIRQHASPKKNEVPIAPKVKTEATVSEVVTPAHKNTSNTPTQIAEKPIKNEVLQQPAVEKESILGSIGKTEELPPLKTNKIEAAPLKSNYEKALVRAHREGRFTFLKFGATWCTPCKIMESSVFQHTPIKDLLGQRFVTVNLDIDQLEGLMIKTKFSVEQVPTFILLDERGQELGRINGSTSSKKMLTFLESVVPFMPEQEYVSESSMTAADK